MYLYSLLLSLSYILADVTLEPHHLNTDISFVYKQETQNEKCKDLNDNIVMCKILHVLAILPYSAPDSNTGIDELGFLAYERAGPTFELGLKRLSELVNADPKQLPGYALRIITVDSGGDLTLAKQAASNILSSKSYNVAVILAFSKISAEAAVDIGEIWKIPVLIRDPDQALRDIFYSQKTGKIRSLHFQNCQINKLIAWLRLAKFVSDPNARKPNKKFKIKDMIAITDNSSFQFYPLGDKRSLTPLPTIRTLFNNISTVDNSIDYLLDKLSKEIGITVNIFNLSKKKLFSNRDNKLMALENLLSSSKTKYVLVLSMDINFKRDIEELSCRLYQKRQKGFVFIVPNFYYEEVCKGYTPDCTGKCKELGCSREDIYYSNNIISLGSIKEFLPISKSGGAGDTEEADADPDNAILHSVLKNLKRQNDNSSMLEGIPIKTFVGSFHVTAQYIQEQIGNRKYIDISNLLTRKIRFSNDITCKYGCLDNFVLTDSEGCSSSVNSEEDNCISKCIHTISKARQILPIWICSDKRLKNPYTKENISKRRLTSGNDYIEIKNETDNKYIKVTPNKVSQEITKEYVAQNDKPNNLVKPFNIKMDLLNSNEKFTTLYENIADNELNTQDKFSSSTKNKYSYDKNDLVNGYKVLDTTDENLNEFEEFSNQWQKRSSTNSRRLYVSDFGDDTFVYPYKTYKSAALVSDTLAHFVNGMSIIINNRSQKKYLNQNFELILPYTSESLEEVYDDLIATKSILVAGRVEFTDPHPMLRFIATESISIQQIFPSNNNLIATVKGEDITLISSPRFVHVSFNIILQDWSNAPITDRKENCINGIIKYNECKRCELGYEWNQKLWTCTPCKISYYQSGNITEGNIKCKKCPSGMTTLGIAQTSCISCSNYALLSSLSPKECNSESITFVCPLDKILGQESCERCKKGYQLKNRKCVPCEPGFKGTEINNHPGQYLCTPCLKGTYQDKYGSVKCISCERGYYQDNILSTGCKKCPKDFSETFSEGTVSVEHCRCPENTQYFPVYHDDLNPVTDSVTETRNKDRVYKCQDYKTIVNEIMIIESSSVAPILSLVIAFLGILIMF